MDANDKIARQRLSVLRLAQRLGNASEACRRSGVDRTSFYQWKRRFARDGIEGLRSRPPVHKSHPQTTPADVERRIVALGLKNPAHGCDRIEKSLARDGIEVSAVTIQKILHKADLGTYKTRAAALEARYAAGGKLTAEQNEFIENLNPSFRERGSESDRPGETLCQGMFFLGKFDRSGPVYVHAVVDSFSSYAFALLAPTTGVDATLATLRDRALPFFVKRRLTVESVLTYSSSELSAKWLSNYLESNGISHAVTDGVRANGFVERFRRTTMEEFLRQPSVRRLSRVGIRRLQREFDLWLAFYNHERPHRGYRNYGATPYNRVAGVR